MDIKTILTPEVLSYLVSAVLLPFLVKLIRAGASNFKAKTKNETVNKYLSFAENAIETAVTAVAQTIVDVAKKNGSFTQTVREEAFYQAKSIALSIMTTEAKEAAKEAYGDLNLWLENKIEFYVKRVNADKPG